MPLSEVYVRASCGNCDYEEEVELTALAHHESYDMRNVRARLTRDGWELDRDGEPQLCPDCVEDAASTEVDEEAPATTQENRGE